MLGGGGVSHPSQLTTGLVIKSVTTSPTLAGERMLFILQVSILSEQLTFYLLVFICTIKFSNLATYCIWKGLMNFTEAFECIHKIIECTV